MKALNNEILPNRKERPIKIVQFGEGNFLRAFVDWMIQEGVQNNEFVSKSQIIDSISEFIDPYMNFEAYLQLAEVETLELMISNTTEAGIVLDESDSIEATPPKTFPGKVLAFLLHRYRHFNGDLTKGLYIVPCELIDNNGDELHRCEKRLAEVHHLEEGFMTWLDEANTFTNTLVDRIVPGYPAKRIEEFTNQFGYLDKNMVLGEVFHLWVIEDRNGISSVLKGAEANLNILFVKDIKPYKIRKVRILNGLHTLMVPVSYLYGIDTVGETMNDDLMLTFLNHTVEDEMIPATERYLTADELRQFAKEVYDRFNNPRVRHELMSIALNSTSKFKSRLLPTALDYVERFGKFPTHIEFSLASLLVFFRGKRGTEVIALQDEADFLEFYRNVWNRYEAGTATVRDVVTEFLGMEDHWEMNLNEIPNLTDELTAIVEDILSDGMETALKKVC